MKHSVAANKPVRRKGVTIAAAALSVALVAPFAQSVAFPELTISANAQPGSTPSRVVETLKVNPPTYYANSFGRNSEVGVGGGKTAGPRTVRLTGILSLPDTEEYKDIQTFFPKGTKFEPQRLDWGFTSPGWYGVSRVDESDPEKLRGRTSEMISDAGASGNTKRWPYVVPETGQVIFGLQHQNRTAGTTERVPLRARWTDPETGKNYIWNFEQEIVVGIGRAPKPKAPGDGEVVIQKHSQAEILEKLIKPTPDIRNSAGRLGAFVFGTEKTAVGSNYGLYKGPRGDLLETAKKELGDDFSELPGASGGTYKKSDLPAAQTNHYAFKYEPVKGATESKQPQFHVEGKPDEIVTFRREGGPDSPLPAGAKFAFDGELPKGAEGADIDTETGVVTLANPVNAQVSIPVKVTYDDGTEDKSTVVFIPADKKLNDTVEPSYTKPGEGKLQSEAPIFHPQDDSDSVVDKPENTRFELGEDAPAGLTVKVDEQSGVVTVTPREGESLQTLVEVPVKVVYSDNSVDTATVKFTPAATPDSSTADELAPSYKPLTVEQGETETLEAPTFDKVDTPDTTEADPAPAGTTFKPGDLSNLPDGLTATVNEDGSVELTVGEGVQTGEYKVPVVVRYEDGSEDTAEVSVTVEAKVEDPEPPAPAPVADDLGYSQNLHVAPDNYKRSDSTGMPNLPETIQKQDGDFFRFGELPDGFVPNPNPSWNGVEEIIREGAGESERVLLRLNKQNGKVEVNAGPDADYALEELPVEYADADGNLKGKDTVSVSVRPIAHSWNGEPTKSENGSVNVPYTGSKPDLTQDLTPSVTKGDGEATLDENGNINYTPGADDKPGSEIEVTVSDSDGNPVRVVEFAIPSFADQRDPQGQAVSVFRGEPADDGLAAEGIANRAELPEGTTFAFKGDVDTSTVGTLPEAQIVVVTYPDGSTDEVEVSVTVVDGTEHSWGEDSPVKGNGGDVTVSYTGGGADALGDGAGVEVLSGDGVASLDEDGNVVYTPGEKDQPGDVVQVEVFDGDGDSVGVVEFAIPSFADQRDPMAKDGVTTSEGEPVDAGALIDNKGDLPVGTKFEWEIEPNFGVPGKQFGVVKVNYPDGSSETVGVQLEVSEVDTQADEFEPRGKTVIVGQGGEPDAAEGIANRDELPEGTEFEFDGPVDTSTPGEKSATVIVAYPDGSTEAVGVTVQVGAAEQDLLPDTDRYEPEWNDTAIDDPSQVTVENKGDDLPHGTEVELGWSHGGLNQGKEDWDVDLEENGDITITPGADAQPGDAIVIEVELNYPDGTSETKTFVVQVSGDREEFVPGNFGELPQLTGDDNDDLTAGDVFTEAPTVNPVHPGDNIITGTGKPGATITVTGPNGFSTTTTVHENGNWSVDLTGGATPEAQYIVSQKDGDKNESDQVLVKVGKENVILPTPGAPGSSELPGSSLGSSNFNIPKHLQCAIFAGGVTAIPLILLSPLHNMYEMMINPHLNGLREQFHRELHALDQQVRRGLGVEGHPALQLMDHINGRVNEFNQQLGQFAHDNRHIGLAAAAIAVAGLSFQHCMNTQAAPASSASLVGSSSSSQEQAPARNEATEDNAGGIVGWFQGLFNRN